MVFENKISLHCFFYFSYIYRMLLYTKTVKTWNKCLLYLFFKSYTLMRCCKNVNWQPEGVTNVSAILLSAYHFSGQKLIEVKLNCIENVYNIIPSSPRPMDKITWIILLVLPAELINIFYRKTEEAFIKTYSVLYILKE